MISKRIIPQFLIKGNRLVKGTNFKNFIDVGDPLSQALIYDAQGAEEIILVDIDASREKRIIDTKIIQKIITRCRLPISVGGGIQTLADARKCFQAGADKIILNTSAVLNPKLIKKFVDELGSANVIVAIDVRKNQQHQYDVYIYSGTKVVSQNLSTILQQISQSGAGEVIITSINQEGTLLGLDYDLYKLARKYISVPLIAAGGAGTYDDLVKLFSEIDIDGVALGKMLFLRDYDIVRIKSYLRSQKIPIRDA